MEYIDTLKDPIDRSLKILKTYQGPYEVTLLVETCEFIFSKIVEAEKRRRISSFYFDKIYALLNKYDAIVNGPTGKENRELYVIRGMRNGLVHCDTSFESFDGNISKAIWKVTLEDYIGKTRELMKLEFAVDDLKNFIFEVGELITGNEY